MAPIIQGYRNGDFVVYAGYRVCAVIGFGIFAKYSQTGQLVLTCSDSKNHEVQTASGIFKAH